LWDWAKSRALRQLGKPIPGFLGVPVDRLVDGLNADWSHAAALTELEVDLWLELRRLKTQVVSLADEFPVGSNVMAGAASWICVFEV
jgi:hypothetical protein